MAFQKQNTHIKCENCGYTWKYKGKLKRTTCPNCGNKTRNTNPSETVLPSNDSTLKPKEDLTFEILKNV